MLIPTVIEKSQFGERADLVADVLPDDTIKMNFEFVDDQTRKITL
jgi:hypothetical protein